MPASGPAWCRPVLRYFGRRLLGLAPIVLVVITLAFAANHLTPGDPVLMMLGTQSGDPVLMATVMLAICSSVQPMAR